VVVDRADKIQVPGRREVGLAHDIDLPESVGMRSFEAFYRLDRRQSDPAEMMADQDPSDRLPMDHKLKMILDEPGGSVLPLELRGDDMLFDVLRNALIMAPSPVGQALRTLRQVPGPIPFDGPSCAPELLAGLTDLDLAPYQTQDGVFFSSK